MKKYWNPVMAAFFLLLTSSVVQETHQSNQGEAGDLEGTQDVG